MGNPPPISTIKDPDIGSESMSTIIMVIFRDMSVRSDVRVQTLRDPVAALVAATAAAYEDGGIAGEAGIGTGVRAVGHGRAVVSQGGRGCG